MRRPSLPVQGSGRPQTKAWSLYNALPQSLADFFALRVDKINNKIAPGSDNYNDSEEVVFRDGSIE